MLDRSSPCDPRQEQMSRGKVVIAPVKLLFSWQVHWFGILADKMTEEDMDVRLSWEVCLCQLYFSFFNLTYICYDRHQEKRWIGCHTSTVIVKLNDFVVKKKRNCKMKQKTAEHNVRGTVALLGDRWRNWFEKINLQSPSLLYYDLYLDVSNVVSTACDWWGLYSFPIHFPFSFH